MILLMSVLVESKSLLTRARWKAAREALRQSERSRRSTEARRESIGRTERARDDEVGRRHREEPARDPAVEPAVDVNPRRVDERDDRAVGSSSCRGDEGRYARGREGQDATSQLEEEPGDRASVDAPSWNRDKSPTSAGIHTLRFPTRYRRYA